MNHFEQASRLKLRFTSRKGNLTVEDLWDFSVQSLALVGQRVKKNIRERADNMLPTKDKDIILDDLRLSIIKYMIADKQNKGGVPIPTKPDEIEEIL